MGHPQQDGIMIGDQWGSRRSELRNLTGLRAIAAGWVVVEHFRLVVFTLLPEVDFLRPWIESGYLGVEVFFVLSGFIIAYNYVHQFHRPNLTAYKQFILLRLARIYPAHFASLLAMLLLVLAATRLGVGLSVGGNYTPGIFLANVFLLQAIPVFPAWNPPAWSISAEFAAYLAFPLIAIVLARIRTTYAALAMVGGLTVAGGIAMFALQGTGLSATGGLLIATRISIEFTAGCLLWVVWSKVQQVTPRGWAWIAASAAALGALIIALIGSERALLTVPLIAVFVISSASAGGGLGRILASRLMRWGGRISYSVYMTHFIVLMVLGEVVPTERLAGTSLPLRVLVLAVYFSVAVLAGWLCWVLIEEPGRRLIRSLSERRTR